MSQKLKDALLGGLQKLSQQQTAETLGDRSEYLGASEVGHCPRKTLLTKKAAPAHDLATLLRFQRGHLAEEIVAKAFAAAGYKFERQVEVTDGFLKAHLDFVFTSESAKTKAVLEVKSGQVPSTPYGSWETQLHIQMGLLAQDYPEYSIKGAILALDLVAEIELFNGYTPHETVFQGLKDRAQGIWSDYQRMVDGEEVEPSTEVTPLCGYCPHFSSCPRFNAEEVPELDGKAEELAVLQAQHKGLGKQIDSLKGDLLAIASQRGPIRASNLYLREAQRSKKVWIVDRLEEFLKEHDRSVDEFQESRPYSFLEVKKAA